jgi:hypothetical protein
LNRKCSKWDRVGECAESGTMAYEIWVVSGIKYAESGSKCKKMSVSGPSNKKMLLSGPMWSLLVSGVMWSYIKISICYNSLLSITVIIVLSRTNYASLSQAALRSSVASSIT